MTEREWLTCTDGVEMVNYWNDRFTERKARLLMLACCQRHERHFAHPVVREAVAALTTHYADPLAPDRSFDEDSYRDLYARIDEYTDMDLPDPIWGVAWGVWIAVKPASLVAQENRSLVWLVGHCLHGDPYGSTQSAEITDERAAQALLVREVFGNSFQPVTVNPAWRTDTVLALARQMYAADDFSGMPILADALQDAGCNNDDVLGHCRDVKQPHVRGCWVVDSLFDKA